MPHEEFSYQATVFRQRSGAPVQIAFIAPSSEIDRWARVPTKRTGNIRNFQRAEMPRHVSEVTRFFEDETNASPTAIVIGFDPARSRNVVRLLADDGSSIDTAALDAGETAVGRVLVRSLEPAEFSDPEDRVKYIVSLRDSIRTVVFEELQEISTIDEEKLQTLLIEFDQRAALGAPELSGNLEFDEVEGDEPDELQEEDEDDVQDENGEQDLSQLSDAAREALRGRTPSEAQVIIGRMEFLAQLQPTVLERYGDEKVAALQEEVVDELKPGLIIDGQHRVKGSSGVARIPFLVCALPNAPWPELAFQFIVTNRTARKVQESLLINIVGNSLSKQQREEIEERLRNAGIRVGLIEAVMRVHQDPLSPFFAMLAFQIPNEQGFIDAAAFRSKVVKLWYNRRPPVRELFDHFCEGRLQRDRTDYWKSEETWFSFFIAFWSAVRDRYSGSQVFSTELEDQARRLPVSRFMTATVLRIFQETVLKHIWHYLRNKQQMEGEPISDSIESADDFEEIVRNTLSNLTPEFFQGWKITGFDGSKNAREFLAEAIDEVIKGNKTVGQLKRTGNPHPLFKEGVEV